MRFLLSILSCCSRRHFIVMLFFVVTCSFLDALSAAEKADVTGGLPQRNVLDIVVDDLQTS